MTYSDRATAPAGRAEAEGRNSWATKTRRDSTFDIEVLPRIQCAGSLAFRTAMGLDEGVDKDEVLVAIGHMLSNAERWAS
jgi:hypothetical protein